MPLLVPAHVTNVLQSKRYEHKCVLPQESCDVYSLDKYTMSRLDTVNGSASLAKYLQLCILLSLTADGTYPGNAPCVCPQCMPYYITQPPPPQLSAPANMPPPQPHQNGIVYQG